jgi:hypothetical protein
MSDPAEEMIVLLYGIDDGCGLIAPFPTGITFQQQTGGLRCFQSYLEGFFFPVAWRRVVEAAKSAFLEHDRGESLAEMGELPDLIDRALAEETRGALRLDRTKLRRSHEAWLWLEGDFSCWLEGFKVREAVFTWENSD